MENIKENYKMVLAEPEGGGTVGSSTLLEITHPPVFTRPIWKRALNNKRDSLLL